MIINKCKFLLTILFFNLLISQSQFSGNANFSYGKRLNDGSILRLPYRMIELKYANESENFSLNYEFAFEWNRKIDTDFLVDNNPQDFILDLRELYLTWYISIGEIKIGKQIHSWGLVDENSPLDNLNALDYYYLFESGASRKLGSYSFASNLYWNNFTLGFVYSPFHNANRLPIINGQIDSEFPVLIPIIPTKDEIIEIFDPNEFGLNLKYSLDNLDLGVSYFNGYDRIFNLSGVNVFGNGPDLSFPFIDIYYGYRNTEVFGLSSLFFSDELTLRSDIALFSTKDINNIPTIATFNPDLNDSLHITYRGNEESKYFELNLQLEYSFNNNYELLGQLFIYQQLEYSSEPFPEVPSIPNIPDDIPSNLDPQKLFKPGMGSSLAVLSEKAFLFQLSKEFLNNQLKLNVGSLLDFTNNPNGFYDSGEDFIDLNNNEIWDEDEDFTDEINKGFNLYGKLMNFGLEYEFSNNVKLNFIISKIMGSDYYSPTTNYQFNLMEDFSNLKMDLKYSF